MALSVSIYTSLAVTVNQAVGQVDPTATSPINFMVVFSNPVADFTGADMTTSASNGRRHDGRDSQRERHHITSA